MNRTHERLQTIALVESTSISLWFSRVSRVGNHLGGPMGEVIRETERAEVGAVPARRGQALAQSHRCRG